MVPADEASLPLAVDLLRAGEPLVFPTDTVYGIGAHYAIESAVERIYRIKGRPPDKPIALLLADSQDAATVAGRVPDDALRLMARFFPGPLTLVLPKAPAVPKWVTSGTETVAVRVPAHFFARALIRRLGAPLAATSANLSGLPATTTAQEAHAQLGQLVPLVIDGGPCPGGQESTVLDLTGSRPLLLREGAIARGELEAVCGCPVDVVK